MNAKELIKNDGGLKRIHSLGDNYNHENAAKDVLRMKDKLDSILSLTLDENTLYLGSSNGKIYAIKL
jgi:hypothetical protein